jgi:hypothetical protein
MLTKDEILAVILKLSQPDLEAIYAVVSSLINARTGPRTKPPPEHGLAIFNALVSALGLTTYRYEALSPTAKRQFEAKVPTMTGWLDANFKAWAANKTTQQAFMRMMFGLIIADLKGRQVKSSIGVVIANMDRLSAVFSSAFPDYLESGMGHIILERFSK